MTHKENSWHEIDMEGLVNWLLDEKIIRISKGGFTLTPKGHFLSKFLRQFDGEHLDKEFHKILQRFNWSFLDKGRGKLKR